MMTEAAGIASTAVAAAAAANRHRGMRSTYSRSVESYSRGLNATSYMNYLRTSVPPRVRLRSPPGHGGGGGGVGVGVGVGVHIHYQGQYPRGTIDGPSYLSSNPNPHADGYCHPVEYDASRYPYYAAHPNPPSVCPECYRRDLLAYEAEAYRAACAQLRETYAWNLGELLRRHRAAATARAPAQPRAERDLQLEKLYWYYVGRVREAYDDHCRRHRRLFRGPCPPWVLPERAVLRDDDDGHDEERGHEGDGDGDEEKERHGEEDGDVMPAAASRALPPLSGAHEQPPPSPSSTAAAAAATTTTTPLSSGGGGGGSGKGKEREVILSTDGESSVQATSLDGDKSDDEQTVGEGLRTPPPTPDEVAANPQPKPNKVSMQQRLRRLWPAKPTMKSPDKEDLV
ncbi:hypothetical protein SAMD00023353_2701640 [Rosellinia necatrix]|uniref:Uncharacterized protein n=1 Tax=Rosellinia necatrix TaxID=77044 RepID=A0A1W2TGM4_ROSNE|nr:hypothetical protein SAMD00023353_2701640 [Rosellinia necatrix]